MPWRAQAAAYAFDENTGRVLPKDPAQAREAKDKGAGTADLPPSQV